MKPASPVNLFTSLADSLIRKTEMQPVVVEVKFADGTRTFVLQPGDSWHKKLSRRRIEALRASFSQAAGGAAAMKGGDGSGGEVNEPPQKKEKERGVDPPDRAPRGQGQPARPENRNQTKGSGLNFTARGSGLSSATERRAR